MAIDEQGMLVQRLERLIKHGLQVQAVRNWRGESLLHTAAQGAASEMVQLLLQNNADPSMQMLEMRQPGPRKIPRPFMPLEGCTPLHRAVENHAEVVLLECDASVDSRISQNARDVVTLLLENGASVDSKTDEGHAALHWAVARGDCGAATLLIQYGASVNIRDADGATPLHMLIERANCFYADEQMDLVSLLLDHDAQPDTKDFSGCTTLHVAARLDAVDIAKKLLTKGASRNVKNEDGCTPLHLASHFRHSGMVALLKKRNHVDDVVITHVIDAKERDAQLHEQAVDVDAVRIHRVRQPVQRFALNQAQRSIKSHQVANFQPGSSDHTRRLQRPRRHHPVQRLKMESVLDGTIACPSCASRIDVSERGCNLVKCMSEAHGSEFYYFCFHCREELPEHLPCARCPARNDRATRLSVQRSNNKRAAENPIVLSDED
eukprot:7377577-Prymnesium_polylepis.1